MYRRLSALLLFFVLPRRIEVAAGYSGESGAVTAQQKPPALEYRSMFTPKLKDLAIFTITLLATLPQFATADELPAIQYDHTPNAGGNLANRRISGFPPARE